MVLLAEISPAAITVGGSVLGAPQHVDVDRGPDERYGFRYRVVDGDGETLFERSTVGPVLVEAFLEYWSDQSGVDLLGSLPTLGRFPVQVPLLEGAEQVLFEVREDGETYALRGAYDLSRVEGDDLGVATDLVRSTEVLHGRRRGEDRVDVAIVGDGYTAAELPLFREHAARVADRLLGAEPFASFPDRLGVVRVDVASNESGASYDCPDCAVRDTAFGTLFPIALVNRLTGSAYDDRAMFQADQWTLTRALSAVEWDAAIVLVNSDKYGGMAVHVASNTTGQPDYAQIAVHELGHAFGMLGDEYVADACIRSPALGLPENVTDDPRRPPWDHWIAPGTPLPTPAGSDHGIGAWAGAWNCEDLYRPARSCKMRDQGAFCPVCAELLARRVFRFSDPARDVRHEDGAFVIDGAPPDARVRLLRDGEVLAEGTAAEPPSPVRGPVDVEVSIATPLVLRDAGELTETWSFDRP